VRTLLILILGLNAAVFFVGSRAQHVSRASRGLALMFGVIQLFAAVAIYQDWACECPRP
jgi:hypothetical protein